MDITVAQTEDDDVINGQNRVLNGDANGDANGDLTGKVAVNSMSLGIPSDEWFRILGINGAGKITTMGC